MFKAFYTKAYIRQLKNNFYDFKENFVPTFQKLGMRPYNGMASGLVSSEHLLITDKRIDRSKYLYGDVPW